MRQPVDQRCPASSASGAVKHADVGGYEQRAGRVRIDYEKIDRRVWQITADIGRSGAAVRGFENMTEVIAKASKAAECSVGGGGSRRSHRDMRNDTRGQPCADVPPGGRWA